MDTEQEPKKQTVRGDRWTLIRDVAVFQGKLLLDGLRDLVLVPISLVAGLVSLLRGGSEPGPEFYNLLRVGRRSERWINLFGAAERLHGSPDGDEDFAAKDIDEMVSRVESFIIDEYHKGGVTTQTKERLDKAINKLADFAARKRTRG